MLCIKSLFSLPLAHILIQYSFIRDSQFPLHAASFSTIRQWRIYFAALIYSYCLFPVAVTWRGLSSSNKVSIFIVRAELAYERKPFFLLPLRAEIATVSFIHDHEQKRSQLPVMEKCVFHYIRLLSSHFNVSPFVTENVVAFFRQSCCQSNRNTHSIRKHTQTVSFRRKRKIDLISFFDQPFVSIVSSYTLLPQIIISLRSMEIIDCDLPQIDFPQCVYLQWFHISLFFCLRFDLISVFSFDASKHINHLESTFSIVIGKLTFHYFE